MRSSRELRAPKRTAPSGLLISQVAQPTPAFIRFFYAAVGRAFHWTDRLEWTESQWGVYLDGVRAFVAYEHGAPAGFLLLAGDASADVEVSYFGILPEFVGRGIGGALLHHGVAAAWQAGAQRVWLHTCSLDSPAAVPAYQRRGFEVYETSTREQRIVSRRSPW